MEEYDRALPDRDERPSLGGHRFWPPARGVLPALLRAARRPVRRGQPATARPAVRQQEDRGAERTATARGLLLQGEAGVRRLPRADEARHRRQPGDLHPPQVGQSETGASLLLPRSRWSDRRDGDALPRGLAPAPLRDRRAA